MLGPHVSSTITLSNFGGVWSTVVPAVVILGVLDIVLGVIAVRVLTRTLQPLRLPLGYLLAVLFRVSRLEPRFSPEDGNRTELPDRTG